MRKEALEKLKARYQETVALLGNETVARMAAEARAEAAEVRVLEARMQAINIIFDGPPSHDAGRFVEVENDNGESFTVGEWTELPDGLWSLRIVSLPGNVGWK